MRRLVRGVLVAGLLAAPPSASAQVFLATEPNPAFALGPLFVIVNVTPELAPLSVTVLLSLVAPAGGKTSDVRQDLHVLWPAEITGPTAPGLADPALARELESRAFSVTGSGRLAIGVRDRLRIGTTAPSEPADVSASYATFVRRDAPQQGVGSYVRIPWTAKLADPLSVLTLTMPLRGLVAAKPATWLEELFWGRRWVLTASMGDVGPPPSPVFPMYFEHRDRTIRLARDPALLLVSFADSDHLRIEEIAPSAATRRMSRLRAGTELVSLALTPSESLTAQAVRIHFSYFSGRIAWRPIVVSAVILVLSNIAGLFMTTTWIAQRVRRRRRSGGGPPLDAFTRLIPGQTTYDEVLQLCGRPDEEHGHLPSGERRLLLYRGTRAFPSATRDGAGSGPRGWQMEEHEVEVGLDGQRVREVLWRVRRPRPS
jgi:hypothetical protein